MNKKNSAFLILMLLILNGAVIYAQKKITILHTNDTHSRIEPLPETDAKSPHKGGVLRRMNYISQMRQEDKHVLVVDAGDFLQGTPYFNLFKGKVETEAMNMMKYDVATLGNHEFDYGLEGLKKVLKEAKFPIISSNYDFSETILRGLIKPYAIFKRNGVKIGIIGIDVQPLGLIATDNYKGMKFLDPVTTANHYAEKLKKVDKCDLIVCLSHLGYAADKKLAAQSRHIDVIIGGHSHTFMEQPEFISNADNKEVIIHQTSGRGVYVGKIEVELEKIKK